MRICPASVDEGLRSGRSAPASSVDCLDTENRNSLHRREPLRPCARLHVHQRGARIGCGEARFLDCICDAHSRDQSKLPFQRRT